MPEKNQKLILFANGSLPKPELFAEKISPSDFLIAVDGGLGHLCNLGLRPDLIIGDLDSIDQVQLSQFREQDVKIKKYPVEKDQNDLELALHAAVKMNPSTIWIAGAVGDRIDQTLVNIFLLTRKDLADINVHLIDGQRDIFIIREDAKLTGKVGETVSLIPLFEPVSGIRTKGLKYPLNNETLYPDQTRGVSNCLTNSEAIISLENGLLLCIHRLTTDNERNG